MLIIAAVGNDGKELTKENGVLPAILPPPKGTRDPIIRVGAVTKYNSKTQPQIYMGRNTGSNWGKNFVDIMSPGQSISVLMPSANATIANGTSEATAIVTGAAALIASCNPSATADDIRKAILDNADRFQHLSEKVKEGRVLNIYQAVEKYCQTQLPQKEVQKKEL